MCKKIFRRLITTGLMVFSIINLTMDFTRSAEFITTTIENDKAGNDKYTTITVNFSEDLVIVNKSKLLNLIDALPDGESVIPKKDLISAGIINDGNNIIQIEEELGVDAKFKNLVKNVVDRENLINRIESLGVEAKNIRGWGLSSIHFYNYKNNDDVEIIRKSLSQLFTRNLLRKDLSIMYYSHDNAVNKDELNSAMSKIEKNYLEYVLNKSYVY